jgi:L-rhamnose mutarotase
MSRRAFLLQLEPGAAGEFALRHQTAWTELTRTLREQGVSVYSLFHEPGSNHLFGYVEVASDEAWEAVQEAPVYRRWGRFLSDLVVSDAGSGAKPLREVFHLD